MILIGKPQQTEAAVSIGAAIALLIMVGLVLFLLGILEAVYYSCKPGWVKLKSMTPTLLSPLTASSSYLNLTWFLLAKRGKITVRASTYLMAIAQNDATPETANRLAFSIDSYAAYQLRTAALYHLNEAYSGSRLAMISEARLRGFRG